MCVKIRYCIFNRIVKYVRRGRRGRNSIIMVVISRYRNVNRNRDKWMEMLIRRNSNNNYKIMMMILRYVGVYPSVIYFLVKTNNSKDNNNNIFHK